MAMGHLPFYLLYGFEPTFRFDCISTSQAPAADKQIEMLRKVREDVTLALFLAAERMKFHHDKDLHKLPDYKVGDLVWLDAKNITTTQQTRKLAHRCIGPFKVVHKVGPLNYELDLPSQLKIHPTFYVGLLSPAPTSQISGRSFPKPPPIKVQGEEEWEVDKIIYS